MLLLVTIGLVLVGAVSLVIGFVSNSLPPIYLSIACSVIAGVVLVVFSRMSKRQEAGGPSSSGFRPAPSAGAWTPPSSPPSPPSPPPAPSYRPPTAPVPPVTEPSASPAAGRAPAPASAVAVEDFPIEGYDTLRVSQILPALDGLDLDDLDAVREREEQGKNRTTVLRRIDMLMDELEGVDGTAVEVGATELDAEDEDQVFEEEVDEDLEDFEDEDDLAAGTAADEQDRTTIMPAAGAASSFPIADYDRLPVAQILPLLDDLDDDELDMVVEREEQGKNRAAILDRIDEMFEPLEDEPPPPAPAPQAAVKRTPAKKAPAKKAPAKKAPAKKAPAKKAPAKKAPAKKAPAKSAAVKKAAGKKAAPVKEPSPLSRAATKKAATPAKRPPTTAKKATKKR